MLACECVYSFVMATEAECFKTIDGFCFLFSSKETFSYDQKLVKYEYTATAGDFAPYGFADLIEIHDFHSGNYKISVL